MKDKIREILREGITESLAPTKICIFDFDGTLIDTAVPENGIPLWKSEFGFDWPFSGWWGRPESLDSRTYLNGDSEKIKNHLISLFKNELFDENKIESTVEKVINVNIFKNEPISSVVSAHGKEFNKPGVLTFMMTGRVKKLAPYIEDILIKQNSINFNGYYYNDKSSTLEFKKGKLNEFIQTYPTVKIIEMWDDRVEHLAEFKKFGNDNYPDLQIILNHVVGKSVFKFGEKDDKKSEKGSQ